MSITSIHTTTNSLLTVDAVQTYKVRNISILCDQPRKVHKFADGSQGVSLGQAHYIFSFQCDTDLSTVIMSADSITYTFKREEYLLSNCAFDRIDTWNDRSSGCEVSGIALGWMKVR
jgi:hypothetical protein